MSRLPKYKYTLTDTDMKAIEDELTYAEYRVQTQTEPKEWLRKENHFRILPTGNRASIYQMDLPMKSSGQLENSEYIEVKDNESISPEVKRKMMQPLTKI